MNLEEKFLEWLKLSKNLSEKSANNYVGAVRTISRFLSEELDKKINIFETSNKDDFKQIMELIKNSKKTLNRYNTGNRMYSNGMKHYEEFLKLHTAINQDVYYEEELLEEETQYIEGARKIISVNAYERDKNARNKCLEYHGTDCKICGFNSIKIYGEEFKDRIHVHHIKPLNEIDQQYQVDPINDLIPVCPNCHMILHSRKPAFKPDEVKSFIESHK